MKTFKITLGLILLLFVACQTKPPSLPLTSEPAIVSPILTEVAIVTPTLANPIMTMAVETTVETGEIPLPTTTPSPLPIPSLSPTSIPQPTAKATAGLTISSFTVDKAYIYAGDEVTFTWSSNGASASIQELLPTSYFGQWWSDLPASGSLTVKLTGYNSFGYSLNITDGKGSITTSEIVKIRFYCPTSYFFDPTPDPDLCPGEVNQITAAEQQFEHGRMIWLEGLLSGDGSKQPGRIFVLYDDGTLNFFTDLWQEGDITSDPTLVPPAGFYQPVRGFGRVWREEATVRDKLGWATNEEHAYLAQQQYGPLLDLKGSTMYLSLANTSGVVKLVNHYAWYAWETIKE